MSECKCDLSFGIMFSKSARAISIANALAIWLVAGLVFAVLEMDPNTLKAEDNPSAPTVVIIEKTASLKNHHRY